MITVKQEVQKLQAVSSEVSKYIDDRTNTMNQDILRLEQVSATKIQGILLTKLRMLSVDSSSKILPDETEKSTAAPNPEDIQRRLKALLDRRRAEDPSEPSLLD